MSDKAPRPITLIFGDSAEYVWELRHLFLLTLMVFTSSLLIGYILGGRLPGDPLEQFRRLIPNLEEMTPLTLFLIIAVNNLVKSLIWMLMGILFSLPPILFTILNGFYIGWISHNSTEEHGLLLTVIALTPHGVIELPAVLLSSAAGLALGYHTINRLRGRGSLSEELGRALKLYIRRIAPLLILAALIETSLTPTIIGAVESLIT